MDNGELYKDEIYSLIGCAIEVYNELKFGYLEAVYQEALEIVMNQKGIQFESQKPIRVYFHGKPLEKRYIADIIVEDKILLELKAKDKLTKKDEAQLLNYLRGTQIKVGVLLNFGHYRKLEWKKYLLTPTKYELVDESENILPDDYHEH